MKKYLVYLTRSYEVADKLWKYYSGEDGVERVSCASGNNPIIPRIYLNQGYFYCIITYGDNAKVDPYRLVIA